MSKRIARLLPCVGNTNDGDNLCAFYKVSPPIDGNAVVYMARPPGSDATRVYAVDQLAPSFITDKCPGMPMFHNQPLHATTKVTAPSKVFKEMGYKVKSGTATFVKRHNEVQSYYKLDPPVNEKSYAIVTELGELGLPAVAVHGAENLVDEPAFDRPLVIACTPEIGEAFAKMDYDVA